MKCKNCGHEIVVNRNNQKVHAVGMMTLCCYLTDKRCDCTTPVIKKEFKQIKPYNKKEGIIVATNIKELKQGIKEALPDALTQILRNV